MRVKILTTEELKRINDTALKTDRNRALEPESYEALDPLGIHVVSFTMVHNDIEIRSIIMAKVKERTEPVEVFIDMSFEDFGSLEEIEAGD